MPKATTEGGASSAWEPVTCTECGAQVAPGAPRCPECPSTEFTPAAQEHPGAGEPMTAVEHPADGTTSPLVSNDGEDGGTQAAVTVEPPAPRRPPRPPAA